MNKPLKKSIQQQTSVLRRKPLAAAIASFFAVTPVWSADIAPANGNTTMFNHPTGVPVVNIAAPNGAGLSHNKYTTFNVPNQGAVLNNATQVTMSQLAGSVPVNANLGGRAANVILNEVVSANRSQLNGFLEVAGQQAGVIVANPYGITCNGCGFINTPRVTLTTGAPTFAGDGSLSGFLVNGGNVLVNGAGLNANAQDILDVVARSMTLDGQVNGHDVQIIAGANEFDYGARNVSATGTGTGATPSYAIDSTALGGLYANRIRLIATDNNVGVRMQGELAATTDDLVLTSAGKIELRNKASAARDIAVTYTGSTPADADAITIGGSGNSLSAGRDLDIAGAGLTLDGGKLTANGNLLLDVNSLTESGAAGQRAAAGTVTVNSEGAASLDGASWDAGSALAITADSLSVGSNGASFFASRNATGSLAITTVTGNLDLANAQLKNTNAINLVSASALTLATGASVQGGNNINLSAVSVLQNSGVLKAQQDIVLRVGGAGTLAATLGGEIRSGGALDVAGSGTVPGKNIDLAVSGTVVANTLAIKAEDVSVSGLLQGSSGSSLSADTLTVSGTDAKFITSTQTGSASADVLSVGTLDIGVIGGASKGVVQGKNDIELIIGSALNIFENSAVLGGADVSVRSSNAAAPVSVNNRGTLQAGSPASGSTLLAGSKLDIAGYDNGAGANSAVNFSNIGNVYADILNLKVNTLNNSKLMLASSESDINVVAALNNYAGARILLTSKAGNAGTLNIGSLQNLGTVESAGDMLLTALTALDNNGGKIVSSNGMTIRAGSASILAFTNQGNGVVQAGGTLDMAGQQSSPTTASNNINISNSSGTFTGKDITVKAGTLSNSGTIQAGTVSNGSYAKSSGDDITLDVSSFNNASSSAVLIADNTTITAVQVDNHGAIHAGNLLTMTTSNIENWATGGISGLGSMNVSASSGINNIGLFYSGGLMTVSSAGTIHNKSNFVDGNGDGDFEDEGIDTKQIGQFFAIDDMTMTANKVENQAELESKRDITITAKEILNNIANPGKKWVWSYSFDFRNWHSGDFDGGSSYDTRWGDTDEGDNIFGGMYHILGRTYRVYADFVATVTGHEEFNSPLTTAQRPKIIASNVTLKGFDAANNSGGLISAMTDARGSAGSGFIKIIGNTNSSFSNESLELYKLVYKFKGRRVYDCGFGGDAACADTNPAADERHYIGDEKQPDYDHVYTVLAGGVGGGLRASTDIDFQSTSVTNTGSPYAQDVSIGNPVGAGADEDERGGSTMTAAVGSAGSVNLGGVDGAGLGLSLTLPSNPNGLFVISKNPGSNYLIQSNPLFGLDASYLGSEYLATKLGIPTDTLMRRLGDAAYENYLVRQQLVAQTGLNLIAGLKSEAQQMQMLLDNAAWAAGSLKLKLGVALTPEQANALKQDIVWMVEQEVAGQKVLVPVVYLSSATRAGITNGAQLVADNIAIQGGETFTNTGGTVQASNNLTIQTTGDITNTSGTISGGNVSLASTQGNIVNQTYSQFHGGADDNSTSVGKTAGISATGNLAMDAKGNIINTGANVSAGGDASLNAGGDIVFQALEIKQTSTTGTMGGDGILNKSSERSTVSTTTLQGSGLSVGGNLTSKSGGDTRFTASSADIKGSADIDAGKNFIIESGQQTMSENSSSSNSSAFGINKSESTSTTNAVTQVGSTFNVGGNLKSKSGGDTVLAASNVNVAGNADMTAGGDLRVEDRQNTYSNTTTSSSRGFNGAAGKADDDTKSQYQAGISYEKKDQTDTLNVSLSQGSGLKVGGNANLTAGNTVLIKGSDVESGGDMNVTGKDIKVLAGENSMSQTSSMERSYGGIVASGGGNSAGVALVGGNEKTTSSDSATIARVSTLKSGGNMTRTAEGTITDVGTSIDVGGDFTQSATTIESLAARNTQSSSSTSNSWEVSLGASAQYGGEDLYNKGKEYVDAFKNVQAPQVEMPAIPSVGVDAGFKKNDSSQSSNASQAVTSNIKVGGNMKSTSKNATVLEGTNIDAGGDVELQGGSVDFRAAADTFSSTSSKEDLEVKARVQRDALGGISGSVSADHSKETTSASSSKAVVGSIKSGGNTKVTATTGDVRLEGTNIDAGGSVDLTAEQGSVNVVAARNTESFSSTSSEHSGGLSAGPGNFSVEYSQNDASESSSSNEGVAGTIKAGKSVNVKADKNVTLEGSNLAAGDAVNIEATKGNVDLKAIENTYSYDSKSEGGGGSLSMAKSSAGGKKGGTGAAKGKTKGMGGSGSLDVSVSSETQRVTDQVGGSITAGNLNIKSGGDTRLQGTQADISGAATVNAGGNFTMESAQRTETGSSTSTEVGLAASGQKYTGAGTKGKSGGTTGGSGGTGGTGKKGPKTDPYSGGFASVDVGSEKTSVDRVSNTNASLNAGSFTLNTGGNATLSGANVTAGTVNTDIKGNLVVESRLDKDKSDSSKVDFYAGAGKAVKTPKKMGPDEKAGNMINNVNTATGTGLAVSNQQERNNSTGIGTVSGLVATNGGTINVAGTTTVKGADLGGQDVTVNTRSLLTQSMSTSTEYSKTNGGADLRLQGDKNDDGSAKMKAAPFRATQSQSDGGSQYVGSRVSATVNTASSTTTYTDNVGSTPRSGPALKHQGEALDPRGTIAGNIPAAAVTGAVAQPDVQKTLVLQNTFSKMEAQYGGADKIPAPLKQQVMQAAGVQVAAGSTPDQTLSAMQDSARSSVIAAAKSNGGMNDKQAAEVARMVGLGD